MTAAAFELASAHVALGVLGLAAAMFGLAWLIDRRPADGAFAAQALGAAIAFPGFPMGWYAWLGSWQIPVNILMTAATALGAVEFTRLHLGRPAPNRVRQVAALAAVVMIAAGIAARPRLAVIAGLGFSWVCVVYAIVAHAPLLRDRGGRGARDATVLLLAWAIVGVGSTPFTLALLGMDPLLPVNTLPAAAACFAALHAFVLVAERAEALRVARRQAHALETLDLELRRQVRKRADELAAGAGRLLSALRATDAPPPRAGDTIDKRYTLERELGRGGMGVVFVARRADGSRFALKLLHGRPDPTGAARFAREARLAAQVRHPNVVRVHDLGLTDDGRMFVVFELVEGTTLSKPPAPDRRAAIAAGVAEGLAAIHELGIAHRDLKPSNILIGADGTPRITDFGIATPSSRAHFVDTASIAVTHPMTLTESGEVLGTPQYMAPELRRSDAEPSPAADVFALGLVLFELFCGRKAFTAPPVFSPQPLDDASRAALDRAASAALGALIASCLALAPDERPTASEVATACVAEAP